jgi:hypothetical protein
MPEDLPSEPSIKPLLEEGRRTKKKQRAKANRDEKNSPTQDSLL